VSDVDLFFAARSVRSLLQDYLKEDSCGGVMHGDVWDQYSRMRDALNKTGRPIYYSITEALTHADGPVTTKMRCMGVFTVMPWVAEGKDPRALANSFLVEYCNNYDNFGFTGGVPRTTGTLSQIDSQALLTYDNLTEAGAFNDMDMLEVCNGGQSATEYRSAFSIWSILTSPMILGNDARTLSAECTEIVLNLEVLAVNQDDNVVRAPLVYQWPDEHWPASTGRRRLDSAESPSMPVLTGSVLFEPCRSNPVANQTWSWFSQSGASQHQEVPGGRRMLRAGGGQGDACLTYGGVREDNLGLASCQGWDKPDWGGQSWTLSKKKTAFVTKDSQGVVAGQQQRLEMPCCPSKCLAAYNCAPEQGESLEVCTCTGLDCGANGTHCPKAMEFVVETLPSGPASVRISSSLEPELCLTAAQFPHAAINITLQVWAKPLASGAVAAVAFNRGQHTARLNVTWEMISVPGDAHAVHSVRDLWMKEDVGRFAGGYIAVVEPHGVVMVVVS
jgi:hypothetical protein